MKDELTFSSQAPSPQESYDAVHGDGPVADGHDSDTDGFPIPCSIRWQGPDPGQNGPHIVQHTGSKENRHQRHQLRTVPCSGYSGARLARQESAGVPGGRATKLSGIRASASLIRR